MKKNILKGIGYLLLLIVVIIGLIIYNMSSQYKKLSQGKFVSNIITDTIPFTYSTTGHILINVKTNGSNKLYPLISDFRRFIKARIDVYRSSATATAVLRDW